MREDAESSELVDMTEAFLLRSAKDGRKADSGGARDTSTRIMQ